MKSMMTACREFFGLKPGESAMDFGREMLKLTDADREEIASGLAANGYEIDPKTILKGPTATV